jgi:uncharacterized protein (DUF488 family)
MKKPTIYTIGHSTRPIEEFLDLLQAHHIGQVVDVRTIAKSRHNPQFGEDELRKSLARRKIDYQRMEGLGGLRHTTKDSVNTAWRNASFRGYADYMQTPEFAENIERLIAGAKDKTTVIMCAEAVPWRCHRSLIGDALLIRGVRVEDIMSAKAAHPHKLTPWARVNG